MNPPTYNAYVTVGSIEQDLSTPAGVELAIQHCRQTGVDKVILEAYRGGTVIAEERLRELRDAFRHAGFETSGGLMPVHGPGFGKRTVGIETRCGFFCYSDEPTRGAIEAEVRKLARLFDEVIIDDALLTSCRCAECDAAREGRSWAKFRRELMSAFSQRLVEAAHDESDRAKLVLKLPQYYDRYERFGYDPVDQGRIYDGIWVGTETRDPSTLAYGYVEPYQPWFHVGWVRQCVGEKFQGAWFDDLDCDGQLFYEQAVTTTLTGPGQVTLFCYGEPIFGGPDAIAGRIAEARDALDRLAALAVEPVGIPAYRPARSEGDGDLFIFDGLGMLGLPLSPIVAIDEGVSNVIIPAHGASDPEAPARILAILLRGGQVILTLNALHRMSDDRRLLAAFGYDAAGVTTGRSDADRLIVEDETIELAQPCRIAGDLAPHDAAAPIEAVVGTCEGGPHRVPLMSVKRHDGGGRAIVWNLDGCRHDDFPISEPLNVPRRFGMLDLPQAALDVLREAALEPMGVEIRAPARVAVYLFRRSLVFVNYRDDPAEVRFAGLAVQSDAVLTDRAGSRCMSDAALLEPRSFLAVPLTTSSGSGSFFGASEASPSRTKEGA